MGRMVKRFPHQWRQGDRSVRGGYFREVLWGLWGLVSFFLPFLLEKACTEPYISSKVPDAALYPQGRRMPTVVLEAGYTESYTQLLRDATLLLEGSGSRISYVILVKVSVLKRNERSITRAFVELHTLDPISNTRIKVSRNVSFIPRSPCFPLILI